MYMKILFTNNKSASYTMVLYKNLAIANRSRVRCAYNSSSASHDLKIYVKGNSRSLETETLNRSYTTYY